MATANCTYNGQAMFNGGWVPSNGYSKSQDAYVGNGNGYGACQQFSIPSAAGSASGRSLTITLNLMTLYSSSFTLQYWVTTEGRPAGVNYGSGPPAIKGTTIVSGSYNVSGLNTSNWKAVTFTTPTTSSLPTGGGTYYLWLRATANGVVRASTATYVLNYTATTACGAPTSFTNGTQFYGGLNGGTGQVTVSWSGAFAGVGNSITGYAIQAKYPGGSWYDKWSGTGSSVTLSFDGTKGSTITIELRIQTRGSAGSSYYSGWKYGSVVALGRTACGAPTSFSASPNPFEGIVNLSWSGAWGGLNNSITSYELQYATSPNNSSWSGWSAISNNIVSSSSTSGSTTDASDIARGTYQKYRVRARGLAGSSYYSGWKESNSVRKNSAPGAPTAFSASSTLISSGATITLSWSGASDANGNIAKYEIQKSVNGGSTWTAVKTATTTATSGSTTVTLSEGAGTTVQLRIRTVDAFGVASGYKTGVSVVINSAPSAPTSFAASKTLISSGESVTLSWSGASDANGNIAKYEIQESVNSGAWNLLSTVTTTATSGSVLFNYTPSPAGNTYSYRIRTVDALGLASGYKTGVTITINSPPTAPTSFTVSKTVYNQGDSLELSWSGASDPDGNITRYKIQYRKTEKDVWQNWIDCTTVSTTGTNGSKTITPTMPTGAENHEKLQFRVRTEDTLGAVSAYKESSQILRDDYTGVKIWDGATWKKSYVHVNIVGVETEAELLVCINGVYIKGVD